MAEENLDPQLDPQSADVQTDPAQAQAPSFNPQDYGYQFRHETVYPKDRNELMELVQLGRSYRENKPKWETERNQYAQDKLRYQQYDAFQQALSQHPDFARELRELAQKYSQQPQSQEDPRFSQLQSQVQEMAAWRADYELATEMDSLQKSFPNYDWNRDTGEGNLRRQVLIFMRDHGITKPEMAFRAMMYEQSIRDAHLQGANKAAAATQAASRAGVVAGGGAKPPAKPVQRANGYGQAADFSLAELGIT